ncbi:MAG: HAMP domain-containing protein [Deltaproteobacteria bacterium]|nr:HAMP domain-containing protein [Deltaproteobacteria bacterium]
MSVHLEEPGAIETEPAGVEGRLNRRDAWLIALVALGVFLFAVFEARLPQFSSAQSLMNHLTFFLLINLNVLLLVVFVFLVGRNLVKLMLERRQRIPGSHLRTRLVVAFVGLSLVPAVLLFIASTNFMDNSIEKWFDEQVERSLEGSHEVVQAFYQTTAQSMRTRAREIAADVAVRGLMAPERGAELTRYAEARRAEAGLGAVAVFSPQRDLRAVAFSAAAGSITVAPEGAAFRELLEGEEITRIEPLGGGDIVRGAAPIVVQGSVVGAVVVDQYVPVSLAQRSEGIERSFREYRELKILKQPIKNTYLLTLTLITLVVVFAATWYGLSLAKGITVPIQQLAEGTREVAHGNWDVRIPGAGGDEIGTLVSAFNQMTGDLKKFNAELEERRRHMETVLANIRAGVVSVSPAGTITTWNAAAERLLGISARQTRGRTASEVLAGPALEPVRSMLDELLATGVSQSERQVEVVHSDDAFTLLAAAAPLREPAASPEAPTGAVLFFEDITQILKVQRMEAWREVAQRIAHEIKNPLTPIQLSAQRLQKRYAHILREEVFEECTRTIVKQVEDLKTLVNEFSSFARLPTGHHRPEDLNALVEEAVVLFREGHREIRFDVRTDPAVPALLLDREGIKRALINMLDNAVAACGNGRGSAAKIEITTAYLESLDLVRLELADNGSGMTPEVKARLFEPYFSTKKHGTGLGLAIVSAIFSDHHAFIRVRDNEPKGSRFVVEFPVRGEAANA